MTSEYQLGEQNIITGIGDWLSITILLILVLYVITRLLFPKYWRRYHQAMIFPVEASKLLEERNTNLLQVAVVLNFLAVVSLSMFVYLGVNRDLGKVSGDVDPIKLLFLISIGLGLTLLKYFGTRLLGTLFKREEISIVYNHAWLINLKYFGFVVFLWFVMLCFLPHGLVFIALWGGWATIFIMLIMNSIRGLLLLRQAKISLLYGILYLCTLEILPILMISRIISF